MYRHEKRPLPTRDALDGRHAYRLKQWPQIPERFRTARVLGACSRMTVGPVTANWLLKHTGLAAPEAVELIAALVEQGALECIVLAARVGGQPAIVPERPSAADKLRERLAHRFHWKQAAMATIVCLGMTAALDQHLARDARLIALPNLPVVSG